MPHSPLGAYLENLDYKFTVNGRPISESWLNYTNSDMFSITGHKNEYLYRENRKGEGVSLFIQNNLAYKTQEDLKLIKI